MYHLHVRRVSRASENSAIDRLSYICRAGRYVNSGDQVREVRSLGMPFFATSQSAQEYWRGTDSSSMRANGRLMFTIEFSLPRNLEAAAQNRLAFNFSRFISRMSSDHTHRAFLPCTYAIHEGIKPNDAITARLPNPHVHLLLSPCINDGHARDAEKWFRRANSKFPDEGGAPRSKYVGSKKWLNHVRRAWARIANAALRRAGLQEDLDHRSHQDRGLPTLPTIHVGTSLEKMLRMGKIAKKLKRNIRINEFNTKFLLLQKNSRNEDGRSERSDREYRSAKNNLQQSIKLMVSRLECEISTHAFAKGKKSLLSAATVYVSGAALKDSLDEDGDHYEVRCAEVKRAFGDSCVSIFAFDLFWYLFPPSDSVLVIGRGYLATDAKDVEFLQRIALAVRSMNFGNLHGQVKSEIRDKLANIFDKGPISCKWNDHQKAFKRSP